MSEIFQQEPFEIEDDTNDDEEVGSHIEFEIATYPSDLTLSVLHEMWQNKDILIPSFQRNFVWTLKQSSQLIESFLLGLPVPQIFLYIDNEHKNLVIDGQQRIMSIVFFLEGYFGFENLQGRRTVFRLNSLPKDSPYLNKRFEDLSQNDQRRLKGAVLRAVNIRQLSPSNNSTSMYHIFERLNTGGTPLKPQEIRNCVFHGQIVDALHDLNADKNWRLIIARPSLDKSQRDVEMILRAFAISERASTYEKPMKEFLNQQMKRHSVDKDGALSTFAQAFKKATAAITTLLPEKPFHIRGPLNVSAMDSVIATLVRHKDKIPTDLAERYKALLGDPKYRQAIYFNTSDATSIRDRLALAKQYLIP